MATSVTAHLPALGAEALLHFAAEFTFGTGCRDLDETYGKDADFVLLEVRGPAQFSHGSISGAINLPHGKIVRSRMAKWREESIMVSNRAGHRCKGAARGALRLAELGSSIDMIAGCVAGRLGQGSNLVSDEAW